MHSARACLTGSVTQFFPTIRPPSSSSKPTSRCDVSPHKGSSELAPDACVRVYCAMFRCATHTREHEFGSPRLTRVSAGSKDPALRATAPRARARCEDASRISLPYGIGRQTAWRTTSPQRALGALRQLQWTALSRGPYDCAPQRWVWWPRLSVAERATYNMSVRLAGHLLSSELHWWTLLSSHLRWPLLCVHSGSRPGAWGA